MRRTWRPALETMRETSMMRRSTELTRLLTLLVDRLLTLSPQIALPTSQMLLGLPQELPAMQRCAAPTRLLPHPSEIMFLMPQTQSGMPQEMRMMQCRTALARLQTLPSETSRE